MNLKFECLVLKLGFLVEEELGMKKMKEAALILECSCCRMPRFLSSKSPLSISDGICNNLRQSTTQKQIPNSRKEKQTQKSTREETNWLSKQRFHSYKLN